MDRRIRLRHLRCFLEIARWKNLARAARALNLSQPAVTKTLQDLERILDVVLVERGRHGASLTPFGEVFLPRASACVIELENAVRSVTQIKGQSGLRARVGALPTVAAQIMPRAVRRFQQQGTDAIVRVVSAPNTHLLDLLRRDELDLVVGRLGAPEYMHDLSFIHLYSEPVRFVVRPGHPLLEKPKPDQRQISGFPVILPDTDAVIRPSVDRLLITLGIANLPNRVESVSTGFGRAFTMDTDAIWIISEGVVIRDLQQSMLFALDIDTADSSGPVGLTARADASPSPGIALLSQAIRWAAQNK